MRLPGELELQKMITKDLAAEFQVCSDMLGIGTGIFVQSVRPNPTNEMDHFEAWMCLGIVAKACRQYRGIVALAEIALADVANSNGRMLMETMLAAEFLMRPTITLKQGGKPVPEVPGYLLTTAFRTKLYLAHDASSTLKTLREMAKQGDMITEEAKRSVALAEKHWKDRSAEIGPEWTERQRVGRSYSGVSVLDLAQSIDMAFLYHTFYRPASASVHGTDARKYIDPVERPDGGTSFRACSSDKGVAEVLLFASLAMLQILNVANQRFGLGLDEKLSEVAPRIQTMAHGFPED